MLVLKELVFSGVTMILVIYFLGFYKKIRKNLPPGFLNLLNKNRGSQLPEPWGFPIIGHFPFLGKHQARTFMKWKEQYGYIFLVRFGSVPTIILSDARLIRKAFSMEEFSGRPQLPVFVNMTGGKGFAFVDGPVHVEQRNFAIKTIKEYGYSKSSVECRTREEIFKLIDNLKSIMKQRPGQPLEMNKMFQYCITNVLWDAMMGTRFNESDKTLSYLVKMIEKGADTNSSIVSKLFWFFPWVSCLGSFFGYSYNPPVESFKTIYDFMRHKLEEMKLLHVQGQPKNFTDAYFDKVAETTDRNSSFHESQQQQPMSTADIFLGATDTTPLTMDWLLIYMARNPHIQRQLQEEIDSVIGFSDCLLSDRTKMPFTEAIIYEVLRISSVAPFAVFHRTVQDVTLQGYDVPKDTMVISNFFEVHHDPKIWEEPEKFNPHRFLDDSGKLNKWTREVMAFSIGKRKCPGEIFARDILFLITAIFFQQFCVSCTDSPPSLDCHFGFAICPYKSKMHLMERKIKC